MELCNKSVLVTGGAGFIGSHLAEALVHMGARLTIVDNLCSGCLDNLRAITSQVVFHRMDIRSPDFARFLVAGGFDVIFHLAANAYVPPSVENPDFDFQTNLCAPFRMFEALRRSSQRPVIIVASSAAVYGNPEHIPVTEEEPTIPVSPYGVSKLAMERYLAVFSQLYDFKAAVMRLFSVYGPRQHKQIVFDFIGKLWENPHQIQILGDGSQVRDLVYVKDVAQALICAAEKAPQHGEVYNVAVGEGCSTRQIAETISRAMKTSPKFTYTGAIRPGDSDKWIANINRLRYLGFNPAIPFEQGIRQTVAWYYRTHRGERRRLERLPGDKFYEMQP